VAAAGLLSGCAATSKTFYSNPQRVSDTQLCRTVMDAASKGQEQFARDTATEAVRRGLNYETCKSKVDTESGVLLATAVVATAVGVGIACSNGCSGFGGGGGGYYAAANNDVDCMGGGGDGPRYVQGPVRVDWNDPYDLDRDGDGIGCEIDDWGK
jgi:hypothetical protein